MSPSDDRNSYNILLIGQTGSGKTSFLDLMRLFNDTEKFGWSVALEIKLQNLMLEISNEMESDTNASSYNGVKFGDLELGIDDTPGFGDSCGFEKDKENVRNIVDKVKDVYYIHAICLIINGAEARISPQLRYVASEIPPILPKATVSNIVVIFTNVCNKSRANFKLSKLAEFLGRDIPESSAFYIDNPYCIKEFPSIPEAFIKI